MKIEYANSSDFDFLTNFDKHISEDELKKALSDKRIIILKNANEYCAWLRFGLFWDNTPFLNMLMVLENHRNKGYACALLQFWETAMKNQGYNLLLASSQSDENAQNLYRKLGYSDAGVLLLKTQVSELIFSKELKS